MMYEYEDFSEQVAIFEPSDIYLLSTITRPGNFQLFPV